LRFSKVWQVEGIHDQDTANQIAVGLIDTYGREEVETDRSFLGSVQESE
jgi:hypothetical protein